MHRQPINGHTTRTVTRPGRRGLRAGRRSLALLAIGGLLLGACGGDDDGADETDASESTVASATDVSSTDVSSTDASSTDASSTTAATASSSPDSASESTATDESGASERFAPQPLAEPATITMNLPILADTLAHVVLAEQLGEFEKENLTVEFVQLPTADALPQLAAGDIDVIASSWNAALVNAVSAGVELQAVLSNGVSAEGTEGIWALNDVASQGPAALEGENIGSAIGAGSVGSLYLEEYLQGGGLDITGITWERLPATEVPLAMQNGAVVAAYVTSPAYLQIQDIATFVAGPPAGFAPGALFFGPSLLGGDPAVGDAFVRAILRTMDTYLQGDYKADPDTLAALSQGLELEPDVIATTPSWIFDVDSLISEDVLTAMQEIWIKEPDVMQVDAPLDPEQLVDQTFHEHALSG